MTEADELRGRLELAQEALGEIASLDASDPKLTKTDVGKILRRAKLIAAVALLVAANAQEA